MPRSAVRKWCQILLPDIVARFCRQILLPDFVLHPPQPPLPNTATSAVKLHTPPCFYWILLAEVTLEVCQPARNVSGASSVSGYKMAYICILENPRSTSSFPTLHCDLFRPNSSTTPDCHLACFHLQVPWLQNPHPFPRRSGNATNKPSLGSIAQAHSKVWFQKCKGNMASRPRKFTSIPCVRGRMN